jgi:hypothetical protein
MKYRYSPIYKYILLAILYYLFLKSYKSIYNHDYFIVSLTFGIMIMAIDYMIIDKYTLFVINKPDKSIKKLQKNPDIQHNLDILIQDN